MTDAINLTPEEQAAADLAAQELEAQRLADIEAQRVLDEAEELARIEAEELAAQEVDNSHLITVSKDGEEIDVHPSCLADHKRIGWKEA